MTASVRDPRHCILPPNLLDRLARTGDQALREAALDALRLDARFRLARAEAAARRGGPAAQPVTFARLGGSPQRTIHDQHHATAQTFGAVVRSEGQPPASGSASD